MKRGDLIIAVLTVAIALSGLYFFYLRPPAQPEARIIIQVDGVDKYTFPLYQDGRNEDIEIQGHQGITLVHLAEDRVWVVDSACPDKICVKTGWTNSTGKPIACLPNRVIVKIKGDAGEGDLDLR